MIGRTAQPRRPRERILTIVAIPIIALLSVIAIVVALTSRIHPAAPHLVLAEDLPVAEGTTLSSIDSVQQNGRAVKLGAGGRYLIDGHADVRFVGWAFDAGSMQPAAGVVTIVDGERYFRASSGLARPDVGAAYHRAGLARSGFDATLSASTLSAGFHTLGLGIVSNDSSSIYLTRPLSVSVAGTPCSSTERAFHNPKR